MLIYYLNWLKFDIFILPEWVPAISNKVAEPQEDKFTGESYKTDFFFYKCTMLSTCCSSAVITASSLSFIKILRAGVKCDLSRNSCMEGYIQEGYTHIRIMHVYIKCGVQRKQTCRKTPIWYAPFISINFEGISSQI